MTTRSDRLRRLSELLLEEKRNLWAEVRRELFGQLGDQLQSENDIPQDAGDRSLIDLLEDTGLAVADIRRQQLTRMDQALAQFEQGRYGFCETCGQEIPEARLRAEPFAIRCVDCQQQREMPAKGPGTTL